MHDMFKQAVEEPQQEEESEVSRHRRLVKRIRNHWYRRGYPGIRAWIAKEGEIFSIITNIDEYGFPPR